MKELVNNHGGDDRLQRKILACVFYEPSTRTNCSFQAAMLRLGGNVIAVNEVVKHLYIYHIKCILRIVVATFKYQER